MVWIVQSDDDKAILKEIHEQTPRGAVLIAAAYVEERLVDALKSRLNHHPTIENKIFKGYGPMASFSMRIDFGLLLGIYDENTHRVLRTLKDIRNDFAHKPEPIDFQTQKIRDLCYNLELRGVIDITTKAPNGESQKIFLELKPDGTPKTAFFNAIKYLLLILDMEIKIPPPRKPAPPVFPPLAGPSTSP